MKTGNQTMERLLQLIAADVNVKGEEMRVYLAWITDKESFSACPSVIQGRLPHMDLNQVRRALRGLEAKGYISSNGFGHSADGKRFKKYLLIEAPMPSVKEAAVPSSSTSKEASPQPIPTKGYLLTIPTNEIPNAEHSGKQEGEDSFKDENLTPYKVKSSGWYQHYLKSSIIEQKFNSFPESLKRQAIAIVDKDDFVSFVNENTPKTFRYEDPLALLKAKLG